jgi:flagellar biosynthesis/type III secretory pathway protein FliH
MDILNSKKPLTIADLMKQEKETHRIFEMQQKSLYDRASLLAAVEEMKKKGFKEGFEKGWEEGKRQVKQKVAKALL